ncbi:MAG: hypothetical protein LKF31_02990 [Muribaculaceae bacterium]|jgi:hypothetical protein|nr:hypothetical protein [Muribaculaceae bacterium]
MGSTIFSRINTILTNNKYKIVETDESSIIIRFQLNTMHIYPSDQDDNFVSVLLPNFAPIDSESDKGAFLERCQRLNLEMKVVKIYSLRDIIVASYEFYFQNDDDLEFNIKQSFKSLISAKVAYNKLEQTD